MICGIVAKMDDFKYFFIMILIGRAHTVYLSLWMIMFGESKLKSFPPINNHGKSDDSSQTTKLQRSKGEHDRQ